MNHRHLRFRVLAIAGATAAISLVAANARADPGTVETIEINANATAQAVRLNPPKSTTTITGSTTPTARVGSPVPAEVTPLACGTPLDNFGDGRSGGRVHEGDDIIAPQNTGGTINSPKALPVGKPAEPIQKTPNEDKNAKPVKEGVRLMPAPVVQPAAAKAETEVKNPF